MLRECIYSLSGSGAARRESGIACGFHARCRSWIHPMFGTFPAFQRKYSSTMSSDMIKSQLIRAAAISLILIPALTGCSEQSPEDTSRKAFDSIAKDASALYLTMHPLRSSRLCLEGADSLLFTFSPGEIEHALATIDTLMEAITLLPADYLDDDRIDQSVLLSDWMKGERFVFTQSRTCLDNPLLICWMIEEALMGLPTRPWPAGDGERQAWGIRISRIPALVENASALLKKPGGIHLEETARLLESLSGKMPQLARLAGERYGEPVPELDAARSAMETYRKTIDTFLELRTRSRLIMGMEELSRILQYSEHLDLDPAKMIAEAEKITKRLSRQIAPPGAAVVDPGEKEVTVSVELADSLLGVIEDGLSSRRTFGMKNNPRSPVTASEESWKPLRIPVNPFLTLPVIPESDIRWDFGPGELRKCVPAVFVPAGHKYTVDHLLYDLLLSSSLMSAPDRRACKDKSPVRRIFGSETYRYAWKAHNSGDLTGLFPERRMQLNRFHATERVAALARMILVFRLHSGKYTAEAAREYLREITPLSDAMIESEVIRASVSPTAAFEGIATMTAESMVKKATVDRAGGKPRERVRKLLLDSTGMPPYLLMMRMPS